MDADGSRVRPSSSIASGTYAAYPETPQHAATAIEIAGPLAVLRNGQVTHVFERNRSDRPVYVLRSITSNGETLALSYWNGLIREVSDSAGVVFSITRDGRGRIVSVQDRWGRSVHYGYGASGRLTETLDMAGNVWAYEYGSHGRLTRAIGPNGKDILRMDYDAFGRVIQSHGGREYSYTYGPDETVIKEGIGHVHVFGHNAAGVTNRFDSTNGVWWHLALDERNRVTAIQSSKGEYRYGYGSQGEITNAIETTPNGIESRKYQHDDTGRIASVHSQDGAFTMVNYAGGITTINGPEAQFAFEVSSSGQIAQVEQDDTFIRADYDAEGHLAALRSGTRTVEFNHDFMGRVLDIQYANGEVNQYSYDALGNRSSIDFGSGGAVRYSHDPAGNIVEVVVTERDGEEKRQFVQIGDMNRVENIAYEGMGALDIAYDEIGRAISFDVGADVISVEYAGPDRIGRIVSRATGATWSPNDDGASNQDPQSVMDARLEVLQNDSPGTTHPDYGIVAFDDISFAVDARDPLGLGVPGLSEARQVIAVAEPLFSSNEHGAVMDFEKPSNAVFQPLEYRSTNCCICIIIFPQSVPRNHDETEGGVVCICAPDPSPPPSISIVTPSRTWYIDNDMNMPNIQFVAHLANIDDGSNATFWWALEMIFDKRNAKTYTHTRYGATTIPRWSPAWVGLLAGANKMTVSVTAFVGNSTLTATRSGYQIHGENPTKNQIFGLASQAEYKAICWQESWHKQYGESYRDTPYVGVELPLFGAPDGWGLMHEDPLPSERHLWDWRENLSDGIDHLENTSYSEAITYLTTWYDRDEADATKPDWTWNPHEDTLEVWNDAFARYNTGNTIFSINGNGGNRDCSLNQQGCNYSNAVRGYISSKPWNNY